VVYHIRILEGRWLESIIYPSSSPSIQPRSSQPFVHEHKTIGIEEQSAMGIGASSVNGATIYN